LTSKSTKSANYNVDVANNYSLLNRPSIAAAKTDEKQLTKEMIVLLEESSTCIQWDKATKLIQKIYGQGKKDGLSKGQIRGLVFSYFKGKLGDRQLRRLLPLELKNSTFANKKKNATVKADIMSASNEQNTKKGTIETIANKLKALANEEHHLASEYATTEVQMQKKGEDISAISDIGHAKPTHTGAVQDIAVAPLNPEGAETAAPLASNRTEIVMDTAGEPVKNNSPSRPYSACESRLDDNNNGEEHSMLEFSIPT
jgi:hypothetical protein